MKTILIAHRDIAFAEQPGSVLRNGGYQVIGQPWTLALISWPVQPAAHCDREAELADAIEIFVLDLTSWAHLLTARQPRCDHCSALTKAPRSYQLRDKKIPSPSRGANI